MDWMIILIFAFVTRIKALDEDTGFCTTEKEACQEDTEEEKQKYEKIKWTDDKDYKIRKALDEADDEIVGNPTKAEELFHKILAEHPQSGRANYALARTYQIMIWRSNSTEEKLDLCANTKSILRRTLSWPSVSDYIKTASAHLLLSVAEKDCFESKAEAIEALKQIRDMEPDSRYAVVLCHDLFLEERYEEAEEQIDDILSRNPEHFLLNLLKSTIMKVRDDEKKDVKKANRMLRELDFDEALEGLKKQERTQQQGLLLMDLNYVARELSRRNRNDIKDIILKDASRLHLISSPLQRPLDMMKDLRAKPVWELNDLQAKNRWTNAQSMTGLGQSSDKLKNIMSNINNIKEEAKEIIEDIEGENEGWMEDKTSLVQSGSSFTRGLYLYGKKKHETCSKSSTICKLLKKFTDSSACKKCTSKFMLLKPKTKLLPHIGPTNTRLRSILPVSLPKENIVFNAAGEEVTLEEGKIVIIDDSFENSVSNDSDEDVLLLLIDFHHPDLPDRDKKNGAFTEFVKNKFITY